MTEINRTTSDSELERVLDAYAAAGPNREELKRWIDEYPHYRRELTELTAAWIELSHVEAVPAQMSSTDVQLKAASVMGHVLHTLRTAGELSAKAGAATAAATGHSTTIAASAGAPEEPAPRLIASLLDAAAQNGLDVEVFATRARMSVAIIMSFHRRLVRAASVPREALRTIAEAIQTPPAAVAAYLSAPPQLSAAQQFKALQSPTIADQVDFFALIQSDPELSDADRAYWLSTRN